MYIAQQALAAKCRHKADDLARTLFWAELEAGFQQFRAQFPSRPITEFRSCQRRAIHAQSSRGEYRPSTLRTWLREWQPMGAGQLNHLS